MDRTTDHHVAGRHIWDGGTVTYCSCGTAWYGTTLAQADQRWQEHRPMVDPEDCQFDTFTGDGVGVRVVHLPTGAVGTAEGPIGSSRLRLRALAMEQLTQQIAGLAEQ